MHLDVLNICWIVSKHFILNVLLECIVCIGLICLHWFQSKLDCVSTEACVSTKPSTQNHSLLMRHCSWFVLVWSHTLQTRPLPSRMASMTLAIICDPCGAEQSVTRTISPGQDWRLTWDHLCCVAHVQHVQKRSTMYCICHHHLLEYRSVFQITLVARVGPWVGVSDRGLVVQGHWDHLKLLLRDSWS